jgi:glycyl-tRNA synthetase
MDEAGTPFCITIDSETLASQTVTIRHRDTQQQEKMSIDAVPAWLDGQVGAE